MSFSVEGQKCPVCNGYLFDDDDVVFCPECGAPHHRDCYNAVKHCGLRQFHGTENQYDREKLSQASKPDPHTEEPTVSDGTVKCGMCDNVYDDGLRNCPECGAPNVTRLGGRYVQFDFLGGVSAETDIGDGVTANDAKMFVGANTQRYIPKFAQMAKGRKASWNLLAFFFPGAWAFSRKMYKFGALIATAEVVLDLLMMPFMTALGKYDIGNADNIYNALAKTVLDNFKDIGVFVIAAAFLSAIIYSALMVLMGIFGDKLYYKHTVSKIKEIKETSDDVESDIRTKGGVSFLWFIIAFFAVRYLPGLIFQLLV